MSYRPRKPYRYDDGSATAAGCIVLLLTLGIGALIKALYELLRYKPGVYQPIAPHVPKEGGIPPKIRQQLWGSVGLSLIGFSIAFSMIGSTVASQRNQGYLFLVIGIGGAVCFAFYSLAAKRTAVDLLQVDLSPLAPKSPQTFTLYPQKGAFEPSKSVALVNALLKHEPLLVFEIVATGETTRWQVIDPAGRVRPEALTETIKSNTKNATVTHNEQTTPPGQVVFRQHHFFALANEYAVPIAFVDWLKDDDPLVTLSQRMSLLRSGEAIRYRLTTTTASEFAKTRVRERLKEGSVLPLSVVPTQREDTNLHTLDEKLLNQKLAATLYHAFLVVTVESPLAERVSDLSGVVSDLARFAIPRHNHLVAVGKSSVQQSDQTAGAIELFQAVFANPTDKDALWRKCLMVLSPAELASLWHLPDERFTAPRIAWAGVAIPDAVTTATSDAVQMGVTSGVGPKTPVYVKRADRAYHTYVTGKTGTGKSTLLHNLIHQDMEAGEAVIVIDPHGKLIDDIARSSIPKNRSNDVVHLRFGESGHPVPLNPFRIPPGVSADTTFNLVYWVFRKLFETVWKDRMDYVLRNVIQTLLTDPEATPRDIARVLLEPEYRENMLAKLDENSWALRQFWEWFEGQSPSERMEIASPILTRAGTFLGNHTLSLMTCHPETLPIKTLIRDRMIVLCNLSGENIASEVGTIGAIILAQMFIAAQSLGYLKDGELPRAYVYVDEVERIVTSPIPEMFATARKFGLSLTLANQYLTQLTPETQDGILGNVGTQLVFEVGDKDSRALSRLIEPEVAREQLLKLGTYQMAVKTRTGGASMPAFLVKTLPPPQNQGGVIAQASATRFTPIPAQDVEAWLAKRYTPKPKPKREKKTKEPPQLTSFE
jgi:hypothetical protein